MWRSCRLYGARKRSPLHRLRNQKARVLGGHPGRVYGRYGPLPYGYNACSRAPGKKTQAEEGASAVITHKLYCTDLLVSEQITTRKRSATAVRK